MRIVGCVRIDERRWRQMTCLCIHMSKESLKRAGPGIDGCLKVR